MTIKECYQEFGGDYEGVLQRLMMDKLVDRFLRKFINDPSYSQLMECLDKEDYAEAFKASHTLKGVCLNLCLNGLLKPVFDLTEALRDGKGPAPSDLVEEVKKQYARTIDAINTYIASN